MMDMKRLLLVFVCSIALLLSSCGYYGDSRRDIELARRAEEEHEAELAASGYDDGYEDGLDNGYSAGYEAGYSDGYAAAYKELTGEYP